MTESCNEAYTPPPLERVPCIHYLVHIKKNQVEKEALIDFGSKINAITAVYTTRIGFKV